ncbi:HopJ type III effector protein [Tenacibaculum sp. MAR_2009_124]|uniref:HopJ type III effector protein n=1 Tax=Tenacibaculum sp. MAR_2009_124 TaxID=1250059 RepID=UPI000898915A|nr:HopJ type III effector protein [Tenacibaculum sp. MAR_2009_124]SEC33425.1 HopJ type III effector protein [Tenacibaculum sp. MAR_2009_124]
MTLIDFTAKLNNTPDQIEFSETIATIDANYDFTPTAFKNGETNNNANENNGSCKVFAFALDQNFTQEEALASFGQFYFKDILENPEGIDHQNIRNFIKFGFDGLAFQGIALTPKKQ